MGNIVGGRLVDDNLKYVDASIDDLPGLYLKTDDILFNRTNSYELVGKTGIYTGPDNTATFASYLIRIRLPKMAMVDQLETQLAASRTSAAELLTAVVAELTSPD